MDRASPRRGRYGRLDQKVRRGRLDLVESPSNPLLTVADLDAICAAPRKRGAVLGVDNTFATPLNQHALALRASISGQEHLPPTLLRLSVGIEAVEDLWTDLDRALSNVAKV
jgi:cystathionine beta-lyase/cystathionine gamma-synthase